MPNKPRMPEFDPDDLPFDLDVITEEVRAEDSPAAASIRADSVLTPTDWGRRVSDERTLVCEGACNPDIYDYDQLVDELNSNRPELKAMVAERCRALRHTPHVRSRQEYWDIQRGWIRNFRCSVCGHVRKF